MIPQIFANACGETFVKSQSYGGVGEEKLKN